MRKYWMIEYWPMPPKPCTATVVLFAKNRAVARRKFIRAGIPAVKIVKVWGIESPAAFAKRMNEMGSA